MTTAPAARIRRLTTDELTADEVAAIRALMVAAFGPPGTADGFDDDDWQHALGGVHVVLDVDGEIVAHAAVVEREIHVGGRPLRTGYVEAVATAPALQRSGHGTAVMEAVGDIIRERYELGALGTGSHGFYARFGWRTWQGPTAVRTGSGDVPSPGEDGFIMVLATPTSPPLDPTLPITSDWRPGDAW